MALGESRHRKLAGMIALATGRTKDVEREKGMRTRRPASD